MNKMCFVQDGNENWYLIDVADREVFSECIMFHDKGDYEKLFCERFNPLRICCHPDQYCFTGVQLIEAKENDK